MKKVLFIVAIALLGLGNINAQEGALDKGSWVIEVNTGSKTTGSTAFSLSSINGSTNWSLGGEAGYFIKENLAIKAGLGYTGGVSGLDGTFVYKIGTKYYFNGKIPVGVDFTGASSDGSAANWVGLQAGYAWFVAPNVSIEPTVRYNLTLNEKKGDSAFQALIGFAFHI